MWLVLIPPGFCTCIPLKLEYPSHSDFSVVPKANVTLFLSSCWWLNVQFFSLVAQFCKVLQVLGTDEVEVGPPSGTLWLPYTNDKYWSNFSSLDGQALSTLAGVSGLLTSDVLSVNEILWRIHFSCTVFITDCSCVLLSFSQAQRSLYER